MIAAFSFAICSMVSPRYFWWSRSTLVITATPRSSALVASRRPPRPTSQTSSSTRGARCAIAIAVSISNSVACPSSAATESSVGLMASNAATKSDSLMGSPFSWTRSVYEMRCGLGMKPTACPSSLRIEAMQAPVDPLPLVPAISTPFIPRSIAPRRSRIARVRSVPSFMPKRPSLDMWSRVSRYVIAPLRATSRLRLKRVADEHRAGHRSHPAGIRRQPARDLVDTRPKVADLPAVDPAGADVDDRRAGFDHVFADEAQLARGGDEDVGAAGVRREVARLRVAYGHGRVLLEQQERDRLADEVAAADDDSVRACQLHA